MDNLDFVSIYSLNELTSYDLTLLLGFQKPYYFVGIVLEGLTWLDLQKVEGFSKFGLNKSSGVCTGNSFILNWSILILLFEFTTLQRSSLLDSSLRGVRISSPMNVHNKWACNLIVVKEMSGCGFFVSSLFATPTKEIIHLFKITINE